MINIEVDSQHVQAALDRLAAGASDLRPTMRKIAATLADITEENFSQQGRPRWQALAQPTLLLRRQQRKDGSGKFRILQDTGSLASSVTTRHDDNSATIGSNKVYAAIHQFGGNAGRGKKVKIPARPYLPLTTSEQLQPEARDEVIDTINRHLLSLL